MRRLVLVLLGLPLLMAAGAETPRGVLTIDADGALVTFPQRQLARPLRTARAGNLVVSSGDDALSFRIADRTGRLVQDLRIEPETGKIRLSRKPLLPPPTEEELAAAREARERHGGGGGGDRGGRGGDRGGDRGPRHGGGGHGGGIGFGVFEGFVNFVFESSRNLVHQLRCFGADFVGMNRLIVKETGEEKL